ncbi:MAG: hypothetical protein AB7Q37_10560 [Pyrinomonadaceae bacterium]
MSWPLSLFQLVVVISCLVLVPFVVSAQFDPNELKGISEKLTNLRDEQRYYEAIRFLDDLIEKHPNVAELYFNRAETKLRKGAPISEVLADATLAISSEPANPKYYIERARFLNVALSRSPWRYNYATQIIEDIRKAISVAPEPGQLLTSAMKALETAHEWKELLYITDKFADRPDLAFVVHTARYKAKWRLGDHLGSFNDAVKSLEVLPVAYPGPDNFMIRSIAYGQGTEFPFIEKALTNHLKDREDIYELYDRAIKAYELAAVDFYSDPRPSAIPPGTTSFGPSPAIQLNFLLNNYVSLLENKGRFKECERQLEKLVAQSPRWRGFQRRAKFYESQGRKREAIKDLSTAITLAEASPRTWDWERYFAAPIGVPLYNIWMSEVLEKRADLYVSLSEYKQAVADLEKAIEMNPARSDAIRTKVNSILK